MITADILEVPEGDKSAALEAMGRAVAPLMAKAWESDRKFFGDRPFSLNAQAMAQLWLSGDLKLFVAYDEKQEPVGYLSGVVFGLALDLWLWMAVWRSWALDNCVAGEEAAE